MTLFIMVSYNKIRSERKSLTVGQFGEAESFCRVVIGCVIRDSPAHVHNLKVQSQLAAVLLQLWVGLLNQGIALRSHV